MTDATAEPKLVVLDHPLIHDKLARLRDHTTKPDAFRRIVHEISLLAGYEALRDLPTVDTTVQTPLMEAPAKVLGDPAPAIVGLLRRPCHDRSGVAAVPEAMVGHIGLYRDHETLLPHEYLVKLPTEIAKREVLVVDPMLATGGSVIHALDVLKRNGVTRLRLLSIFGVPEGVANVHAAHPDVPIFLAVLDDQLNDKGYILPGVGDAGDRLYGTR